ncbi:2-phosphoglycolate phosphatase 1 [Striga asiatica]|uniref:2-phosphoglycolate phosphatase 1 n=1 Tax=Striga asiatica TaxID=4170 RepID=A0A5A7QBI4_STRAF|nr:2-phosphoglycolate phosphatase 1 [Striga asiatica]
MPPPYLRRASSVRNSLWRNSTSRMSASTSSCRSPHRRPPDCIRGPPGHRGGGFSRPCVRRSKGCWMGGFLFPSESGGQPILDLASLSVATMGSDRRLLGV